MTTTIFRFLNIVLVALLAGTSFGIWMGLNPLQYSPSTYVEQQQHLVTSLNTLMVSMVILATAITLVSAFLHRKNKPHFIMLLVAAFFLASCIFISRIGNLPIQQEMLLWHSDALPGDWTAQRDQWWSFHIVRTLAEIISLLLVAWVYAQKNETSS